MKVRVCILKKIEICSSNFISELLEDSGPGEVDPIVEGVQFKVGKWIEDI